MNSGLGDDRLGMMQTDDKHNWWPHGLAAQKQPNHKSNWQRAQPNDASAAAPEFRCELACHTDFGFWRQSLFCVSSVQPTCPDSDGKKEPGVGVDWKYKKQQQEQNPNSWIFISELSSLTMNVLETGDWPRHVLEASNAYGGMYSFICCSQCQTARQWVYTRGS